MTSAIPISTAYPHPLASTSRTHAEHDLHKAVDRAFITALLLTANVERAEAAMRRATKAPDLDNMPADSLIRGAVTFALKQQCETVEETREQLEYASSILPFGLRRVLQLATDLRQCFVLRVLMGLPREDCARLLCLEVSEVDDRTCGAMLVLPGVQSNES